MARYDHRAVTLRRAAARELDALLAPSCCCRCHTPDPSWSLPADDWYGADVTGLCLDWFEREIRGRLAVAA